MFNKLKFKNNPSNIFFISDLHYNHDPQWDVPLWKKRGFDSLSAHNEGLVRVWNEKCNSDSIVFNLGDVTFSDPEGKQFMELCRRLNFKEMYVLIGNHTSGHRKIYFETLRTFLDGSLGCNGGNEPQFEIYPLKLEIWENKNVIFLPEYVEVVVDDKPMVLCHYPLDSWNHMSHNSWMIHGHEHGSELRSKPFTLGAGKILDVGVENLLDLREGAPINYGELKKIMDKKQYVKVGHH